MSKFIIKQAFAEAIDLHKKNQLDDAKQIYKKILSVDESDANANHLISLIYLVERNYQDALKHIELAIIKEPNQAIFHSNYGGLLQTIGRIDDAIKSYKKSLKIDKKCFQSLYSLGIIYTDKKEYKKAKDFYIKAINVNEKSAEAHNNLANLYNFLNDDKAEQHYLKTIQLQPQEIYPRLNLSNHYIRLLKFKKAKEVLDELIRADLVSKEVYNNQGIVFKGLDDNSRAEEMFKKALEIDPSFTLAQKNLDSLN